MCYISGKPYNNLITASELESCLQLKEKTARSASLFIPNDQCPTKSSKKKLLDLYAIMFLCVFSKYVETFASCSNSGQNMSKGTVKHIKYKNKNVALIYQLITTKYKLYQIIPKH